MKRHPPREIIAKAALLIVFAAAALVISEVALRVFFPQPEGYYVWPPYLRRTFRPQPGAMPGVEGDARFIINSRGLRSDELTPDHTLRLMTIGGSTTECQYLDQDETWPHILKEILNQNLPGESVWVGNAGKSGQTTRDHIVLMRYLLPNYPKMNMIIMMVGANDFTARLAQDDQYDPSFMDRPLAEIELLPRVFYVLPANYYHSLPFPQRTRLWRLAWGFRHSTLPTGRDQDEAGRKYHTWRKYRLEASVIRKTLPDLSPALKEYKRNIHAIIDAAKERDMHIIFVTQPALWDPDLPESLRVILWFGGVGHFLRNRSQEYYSVESLAEGMKMYNRTLVEICSARNVACLDLVPLIPKDTTAFYDDLHFNESGNQQVANAISNFILEREHYRGFSKPR
ncbi:MAG: hypothetical protein GTO51_09535 [Candidatus Latescibacteria bacterium]|nr:hypothetical protein [Candidatus Latescibacterota bacterium]NIM21841.1 hypothetical protein [Candidatus Latescibacterota bacterium]NIM66212.1 hypothetical protein [Candidatus Latescibacterota bacterium]NIO02736.1 hypothetical protein [Candidatus Latescibacterota bacterium]NIO29278.1 hypothetical protein [Candidatus Latescibacterota bacterium]